VTPGKLLLHQCCAPCSYKVIELFSGRFSITGLWYNPNIHPNSEYNSRREALLRLNDSHGIETADATRMPETDWVAKAPKTAPERCRYCYTLRLNKAAQEAKSRGFSHFSTTLLISPFQNHELIKEAGVAAAMANKVAFYYHDMRQHYYQSKQAAKDAGYYIQKYCGCSFSKEERKIEKLERKSKN